MLARYRMRRALDSFNVRYAAGEKVVTSRAVRLDEADDAAIRRDTNDGHAVDGRRTGSPIWPRHDSGPCRVSLEAKHG
jgi:hypothetical protein